MIRVLFLLSHTEKGGGEVVVYNLIKRLDRGRFEPEVGHVDFRHGDFIHQFRALGVTPVDFRAGRLRNPLRTAAVVWRLARFLRHRGVDVIVASGAHNHVYAALATRIVRVPIVTYVMNHYAPRRGDNPLIVRTALRLGADHYLAASRACLEPLEGLIPREIPRAVVYHGVDEDFFADPPDRSAARARLGVAVEERLSTVIGRLQRWKGQDVFVRAAAEVARACPEARFAVVGGGLFGLEADYGDELRRLAADLGLAGRCQLVGHRSDVRDWMVASDVVVHAARAPEPGANVVMEAMSLGRPVVASACGAPTEIVEDGISGLLFTPEDSSGLAGHVIRILRDPTLAGRLGAGGAARIRDDFTARRMAARVGEVLERVVPVSRRAAVRSKEAPRTVLFTLSSCRRAGLELSMRNIIKVLDRDAYRPLAVFLCQDEDGSFPDELAALGADVVVRRVGRLRGPLNVLRTVRWLARLIRERGVSAVFTAGGHNHVYGRLAALATRRPTVCHEIFFFKAPWWKNGPIYGAGLLLGADAYFSSGEFASRSLSRVAFRSAPVWRHAPMMDRETFDFRRSGAPFRQGLGIPDDAVVFMIVGRIQDWKGQGVFVRAALDVTRVLPDAYFVVVGGGWWDADRRLEHELKRLVAEQGAEKRIRFTGFLDDPVPAYAAADVICHCSTRSEPLGLVILEAFAMKKAVISVTEGGPLELVRHGVDGFLIPPGDPETLAETMKRCAVEPEILRRMGEAGYAKVLQLHGEAPFAATINSLLESVTGPRSLTAVAGGETVR
jgi:glycosyltransferase involved in cell wall biosynthesis